MAVSSVYLVLSFPNPDRVVRARPMVCAPDRATISASDMPMRWNTARRWDAASVDGAGHGAPPAGRLPSFTSDRGPAASLRPYRMASLGPPVASTATAPASWIRSAKDTSACAAATGVRKSSALLRPALAPWASSFLKRMEPVAPPREGKEGWTGEERGVFLGA